MTGIQKLEVFLELLNSYWFVLCNLMAWYIILWKLLVLYHFMLHNIVNGFSSRSTRWPLIWLDHFDTKLLVNSTSFYLVMNASIVWLWFWLGYLEPRLLVQSASFNYEYSTIWLWFDHFTSYYFSNFIIGIM